MDRPKTTVGMKFDPGQWTLDKGAEQTRPGIHQLLVQRPLEPEGEFKFTAIYQADGRLHRVDGIVPAGWALNDVLFDALESHWWRYKPMEAAARRLLEE